MRGNDKPAQTFNAPNEDFLTVERLGDVLVELLVLWKFRIEGQMQAAGRAITGLVNGHFQGAFGDASGLRDLI